MPFDHARAESLRLASVLASAAMSSASRAHKAAVDLSLAASFLQLVHRALVDTQTAASAAQTNYLEFLHSESARVQVMASGLVNGFTTS